MKSHKLFPLLITALLILPASCTKESSNNIRQNNQSDGIAIDTTWDEEIIVPF